ncbi:MAG: hypothetical protein PF693_13680 [Spirochaetia bacterium]|nr:hypothetical protein [Spirochaetia bacterium]
MNSRSNKIIYFFWGPAGVGKTSTLAKYACRDGLLLDNKTVFLTNDDFTVGSKLEIMAGTMGVDYKSISNEPSSSEITNLATYNAVFFDYFTKESIVCIDKVISEFKEYFRIKKIFILNALLLPYTEIIDGLSGFEADELILTFVDYFPMLADSKRTELESTIKTLSNSMEIWISNGRIIQNDLYKYRNIFILGDKHLENPPWPRG